ncbi:hypothetical protein QOZ80_8BG0648180 [Eleusine coracana subsp. coracana]|nr:hypothetical protein QOZ80_8BG0648180 [Eleusine coracana subsp. coracana]
MPRGGRRKRQDGLAGIPEEILHEILVRLPAKSVLRCRAVCQDWRRLTSDPAFLVEHHRHQPMLHLVRSFRSADSHFPDRFDAIDLRSGDRRPDIWLLNYIYGPSCDGLSVIGNRICNPVTRQWAPLSRKRGVWLSNLVGLFWHQPSEEYRVLFWRTSSVRSHMYCPNEYCVLTVGSDDDPRPVNSPEPVATSTRGSTSVHTAVIQGQPVELGLINGSRPTFIGAPVLLHGNMYLHWKRYDRHQILVFDTVAELFWHLRSPPVNPHHIMQLLDMDGSLAVSSSKADMIEMRIFLLQKGGDNGDVWAFQYRIKLPEMEIRRFQEQGDLMVKVVWGGRLTYRLLWLAVAL